MGRERANAAQRWEGMSGGASVGAWLLESGGLWRWDVGCRVMEVPCVEEEGGRGDREPCCGRSERSVDSGPMRS